MINPPSFIRAAFISCLSFFILTSISVAQGISQPLIRYTFESAAPFKNYGSLAADLTASGANTVSETPNGTRGALELSKDGPRYAFADNVTGLHGLRAFTITAWLKVGNIEAEGDRIFSTLSHDQGIDFCISGKANLFTISLAVNNLAGATSDPIEAEPGSWVFVAVTYFTDEERPGVVKFFTGSKSASVTKLGATQGIMEGRGGGPVGGTDGMETSQLRLGATPATTANRTPDLIIDDFRLYGKALEINALDEIAEAGR